MTEREMVKVMEVCKDKEMPCDDCPLVEYGDCEEISRQYFYDRFKQLKAENADLRERLEKAVELPCNVGDTVYLISQTARCPQGEISEAKIIDFICRGDGYRFTAKGKTEFFSFLESDVDIWVFPIRKTAEARLAELKGGKKDD